MTEVVFLVDRSGSMSGSRLRQVKAALQLMLRSFPAGSTFDLVSFGTKFVSLFGGPVVYDEKTFVRASEAVEAYDANMGGTELLAPLREILSRPASQYPRQVVLLTDGEVANTAEVIAMLCFCVVGAVGAILQVENPSCIGPFRVGVEDA